MGLVGKIGNQFKRFYEMGGKIRQYENEYKHLSTEALKEEYDLLQIGATMEALMNMKAEECENLIRLSAVKNILKKRGCVLDDE